MLSDDDDEEEEPPPPSAVARALKSPLPPAVPFAASSWDPSFARASVLSAGAAFVAVVVVKSLKGEKEKDDITILLLSLPNRRTE